MFQHIFKTLFYTRTDERKRCVCLFQTLLFSVKILLADCSGE